MMMEEEAMKNTSPWPQSWTRLTAGFLLGIGLSSAAALPTFAEEQRLWSPAFLSALELWQSRYSDMSFQEYLSLERPDLVTEWSIQASSAMGGSILAVYRDSNPDLVQIYESTYLEQDADGTVTGDDVSFVDFLIHGTDAATFAALEREVESRDGLAMKNFVKGIDAELAEAYDHLPADQPIYQEPLRDFVAEHFQDPVLDAEVEAFEAQSGKVGSVCTCQALAGAVSPSEDTQVIVHVTKPNGHLKEERSWWLTKRGAARRLFTDRYILNGLNDLNMSTHVASGSIQFSMVCARSVNGGTVQCDNGQGCSAKVKLDSRYDSYLWVKNEATRVWPQTYGSSVMTMDVYTLVANPGPGQVVLAEKGLALERNFGTSVSAQSILQGVTSAYNIYTAIEPVIEGSSNFGTLVNELNDDDINNVLGVITSNGTRGESTQGFASSFTNNTSPATLANGQTYKVEMTSYSKAKSRGWGNTSRSRSLTASSFYLAGVATNFVCTGGAVAPAGPKVAWAYGSTYQSPYGAPSLRAAVRAFFLGTTGLTIDVPNSSGTN